MIVWTIANQKGGVGKTTSTVTLGGLLARRGYRCLLVDLDPHGSMSSYFGYDPDVLEESVYSLFSNFANNIRTPLASVLVHTKVHNLHLLPSSTALVSLDRQFGGKDGMGLVLSRALKTWEGKFDFVLMDCPPMLGVLMVNALACCQRVIVPVQTEFLAIKGLQRLEHTLKMINHTRQPALDYLIVPTMYDKRTRAGVDSLQWIKNNYDEDHLWNGHIPIDTRFRECSRIGKPLSTVRPSSKGALAYSHLLDHLLNDLPQSRVKVQGQDNHAA